MTLLLKAAAAIDSQNEAGLTPLHIACHQNHAACGALLLGARAQADLADKSGQTADVHVCVYLQSPLKML